MVRKIRRGGNDNALNRLIAIGKRKLSFAEGFVAFPGSPVYSALISKALGRRNIQTGDGFLSIRDGKIDALAGQVLADTATVWTPFDYDSIKYTPEERRKRWPLEFEPMRAAVADSLVISESGIAYADLAVAIAELLTIADPSFVEQLYTARDTITINATAMILIDAFGVRATDSITLGGSNSGAVFVGVVASDGITVNSDAAGGVEIAVIVGDTLTVYDSAAGNSVLTGAVADALRVATTASAVRGTPPPLSINKATALRIRSTLNDIDMPVLGDLSIGPVEASATIETTASAGLSNIVTVSATTATAAKRDSVNGVFTLTRTGSTASGLTVNFAMSGTADNDGTDYASVGTTAVFSAGNATTTVTINPVESGVSSDWTITAILTLQSGTGYTVGSPSAATVTIDCNLVLNPGFEDGETDWTFGTYWSVQATGGNPGQYARIYDAPLGGDSIFSDIPSVNNGRYTIDLSQKNLVNGANQPLIIITAYDGATPLTESAYSGCQRVIESGTDWENWSPAHYDLDTSTPHTYFLANSATTTIRIMSYFSNCRGGVDNVRCRRSG